MQPRLIILILILALSAGHSQAQKVRISGAIYDMETDLPISDVTVYVNGTTKGCITSSIGLFELHKVILPCELILSHVSYTLRRLFISDTSDLADVRFGMSKKIVPLQEATVMPDSARRNYMARFKAWFLGAGYEETGAKIINDPVLNFIPMEGDLFEAYANEPLEVEIPLTGYRIQIDLVHFRLTFREDLGRHHCSILGYFYFEDTSAGSRRQQRALARKRAEFYYNTRLHFCRSLYENKLKENGYLLESSCLPPETSDTVKFNPGDYKRWFSNSGSGKPVLKLTDFKCSLYNIKYYHSWANKPADLSYLYAHPSNLSRSGLMFASDTISIYSTGRVAENFILFAGDIGNKGVAWMFPEDYIPSMQ